MITAQMLFDKRFKNRVKARYEKYDIQAGILKNKPHVPPKPLWKSKGRGKNKMLVKDLTSVEGMKARKKRTDKAAKSAFQMTTAELAKMLRKRTGVNIWTEPFKKKRSREVKRFMAAMLKVLGAKRIGTLKKRAEDLLVEAIRAPIKQRRYGRNKRSTVKIKGFNRRFFDTGQLYMAISAKIKSVSGKVYGPFQQ